MQDLPACLVLTLECHCVGMLKGQIRDRGASVGMDCRGWGLFPE